MGKAAKPLTQHQKLEAKKAEEALGWIAKKPPPLHLRSKRRIWRTRDHLPARPGWCVVKGADGRVIEAYWNGTQFVLGTRVPLAHWAEIVLKKAAK
jgi:hypothetical protein